MELQEQMVQVVHQVRQELQVKTGLQVRREQAEPMVHQVLVVRQVLMV